MVVAYIEIEKDEKFNGKGDINIIPKNEYWAILHGQNPYRTIFMVDTTQENIDKVKESHKNVKIYTTDEQIQIRGLQIKPGTLTKNEIDAFTVKLKNEKNIDLENKINIVSNKNWKQHLYDTCEHIGIGNIKCLHCGQINEDIRSHCKNCDAILETYLELEIPTEHDKPVFSRTRLRSS